MQFLLWRDRFYNLSKRSFPIIPVQTSDKLAACSQEGKVGPRRYKSVLTSMILLYHSKGCPLAHFGCREFLWLLNHEIRMSFEFCVVSTLGLRIICVDVTLDADRYL